ncbi:hypothetical protein MBLNU13_g11619t1 [Cladosporium sp. NU13]
MARHAQCILFTGAPDSDRLSWDENTLLNDFTIGASKSITARDNTVPQPTASWQAPVWRSISTSPGRAIPDHVLAQTQFFSFSAQIPDLDIATKQDFLEHSIALLDGLVSSQIAPADIDDTSLLNTTTTFSFASETSILSSESQISLSPGTNRPLVPPNLPLTDIGQIPTASHILSIAPQTITLNILCAVISISQPRTVTVRRRQSTMEILDLLVGDETRAGFSVSFWLPPADSQGTRAAKSETDDLRATLQSARPGDVVLIRNVALSVWHKAVYGQSLGRRWAKNCTRIERIDDGALHKGTVLPFGFVGKLARVRGWRDEFVGRRTVGKATRSGKRKFEEELPPDSQD